MVDHITHISTPNTKKVWKNHYSQGIIYLMVLLKKKKRTKKQNPNPKYDPSNRTYTCIMTTRLKFEQY